MNLGLACLVMAAALPGFAQAHLKRLTESEDTGRCIGTMLLIQGSARVLGLAVLRGLAGGRARRGAGRRRGAASRCWGRRWSAGSSDVFLPRVHRARCGSSAHGAMLLPACHPVAATVAVLLVAPSLPGSRRRSYSRRCWPWSWPPRRSPPAGIRARRPSTWDGVDRLLALRAAVPRHHAARADPGLDRPRARRPLGRAHRRRLLPRRARGLWRR